MRDAKFFFIVDDDQDDIDIFIEAVNKVDPSIKCIGVLNGKEAIQKLTATLLLPDIIFLDLNMPRIDGRQCLSEIKKIEKLNHIPVVIYSTSSYEKDRRDTKELGASYFFTKPYNFIDLCKIISSIALGKLIDNSVGK